MINNYIYKKLKPILEFRLDFYTISIIIFAAFFLRPYPDAYLGSGAMRIIDMVILALPILYFLITNTTNTIDKRIAFVLVIFSLLFTFALLSLVNGYLLGVTSFSFRDPLDVIRYLQFPVFIVFGYFFALDSRFDGKDVFKLISFVLIITFLFAILQKLVPAQVNFITKLYAPEHQASRLFSTGRLTTLFGNPNTTALMVCLFSSFFFALLLDKNKLFVINKVKLYGLLGIALLIVLLSGSRTGLITFALLGVIYFYYRIKYKFLFFVILATSLSLIWIFQNQILEVIKYFNTYLYVGIKIVLSLDIDTLFSEGNSFFRRFRKWDTAIEIFQKSPIIGLGPLRGVFESSTDNYYLYILMRYGIIGITLYLSFIFYSIHVANKAKHLGGYLRVYAYAYLFQTYVILFMNFLIEAQIMNSPAYLHFTTFGIFLGYLKKELKFRENGLKFA